MNEKTLDEARLKIAGFLKNRRLELGLTQKEVAQRTGMARETINRMEQGFFWLGMKQFLLICEALHLVPEVAEIGSGEDIEYPNQRKKSHYANTNVMLYCRNTHYH